MSFVLIKGDVLDLLTFADMESEGKKTTWRRLLMRSEKSNEELKEKPLERLNKVSC